MQQAKPDRLLRAIQLVVVVELITQVAPLEALGDLAKSGMPRTGLVQAGVEKAHPGQQAARGGCMAAAAVADGVQQARTASLSSPTHRQQPRHSKLRAGIKMGRLSAGEYSKCLGKT